MLKELCSWYPKTVPDLFRMMEFGLWWGKYRLNLLAPPPPFFLDTAFNLLLFKLKYCYKTSSVQASTVILVLRLSAIL